MCNDIESWLNMNTSFSKESLTSWTNPEPSTPTNRSGQLEKSPSQSEMWTQIETSPSSGTGNPALQPGSPNGETVLSLPNVERFAPSSSLRSRVGSEKLLESQPARKILRISRADFNSMILMLEQYKLHIEKLT